MSDTIFVSLPATTWVEIIATSGSAITGFVSIEQPDNRVIRVREAANGSPPLNTDFNGHTISNFYQYSLVNGQSLYALSPVDAGQVAITQV